MGSSTPSVPENDRELEPSTLDLARLARSDPAGFSRLYERVAPAVHAWASLRLRGRARARLEPEDLSQEIWMRALELFPTSDATHGNFRAWVFSVARFVLHEALRRAERAELDGLSSEESKHGLLANVPDDVTTATRRLARDEALRAFVAHMGRLEPEDRALLVHCGLEGMTGADAGLRLGISRDAVHKRWQRLRAKLQADGIPPGLLHED